MQTVNISLPESLGKKLDRIIAQEGYASRSEFVRALIRFYLVSQDKKQVSLYPFKKVSIKKVESDLTEPGQYNKKFINSVVRGLSKSSVYAKG